MPITFAPPSGMGGGADIYLRALQQSQEGGVRAFEATQRARESQCQMSLARAQFAEHAAEFQQSQQPSARDQWEAQARVQGSLAIHQGQLNQAERMRLDRLSQQHSAVDEAMSNGSITDQEAAQMHDSINIFEQPLQLQAARAQQAAQQQQMTLQGQQIAHNNAIRDFDQRASANNLQSLITDIPNPAMYGPERENQIREWAQMHPNEPNPTPDRIHQATMQALQRLPGGISARVLPMPGGRLQFLERQAPYGTMENPTGVEGQGGTGGAGGTSGTRRGGAGQIDVSRLQRELLDEITANAQHPQRFQAPANAQPGTPAYEAARDTWMGPQGAFGREITRRAQNAQQLHRQVNQQANQPAGQVGPQGQPGTESQQQDIGSAINSLSASLPRWQLPGTPQVQGQVRAMYQRELDFIRDVIRRRGTANLTPALRERITLSLQALQEAENRFGPVRGGQGGQAGQRPATPQPLRPAELWERAFGAPAQVRGDTFQQGVENEGFARTMGQRLRSGGDTAVNQIIGVPGQSPYGQNFAARTVRGILPIIAQPAREIEAFWSGLTGR